MHGLFLLEGYIFEFGNGNPLSIFLTTRKSDKLRHAVCAQAENLCEHAGSVDATILFNYLVHYKPNKLIR